MKKHIAIAGLCCLALSPARAGDLQDLGKVREAALQFLAESLPPVGGERRDAEASPLDPRLRLSACAGSLGTKLAPGSSLGATATIAVSCALPQAWSVYVPVRLLRYAQVATSRQTLNRGARLSAADVELREVNVNSIRGQALASPQSLVGSMLKRTVGPQQALTANDICLICKGEQVEIVAKTASLRVKMPGLAMSDGNSGQLIAVRNRQSNRLLQARVAGPGVVEVLP